MLSTRTGLLGSETVLAERYDVALLDLDGVVYVGPDAVAGAPIALARARQHGMRLAFVTNNAARPPAAVAAHLTELGVPAESTDVTTSAQAAARYLAARIPTGSQVLVVGTVGLTEALIERGLVPVEQDGAEVVAIVQGYSPELNWRQLAQGAIAINRGALWVATNLDPTVPSPKGRLPGNGSLVAALRCATGAEPVSTGKPDPTMHRESVERSGAERPIVVGDRLDTDIEGANAVGCPSLLVFSGVTTPVELLAAPERLRPSYLADDVGGLLMSHSQPLSFPDRVVCGVWSVTGGAVESSAAGSGVKAQDAAGDPAQAVTVLTLALRDRPAAEAAVAGEPGQRVWELDALRALCTATWKQDGDVRYESGDESAQRALIALGLIP